VTVGTYFFEAAFSTLRSCVTLAVLLGGRVGVDGKKPCGRHLLGPNRHLNAGEDSLTDVGMLAQERGRVLAPLAQPLVAKLKYEPDFVTTLRSSPASRTVPSQEMPDP